MHNLYHMMFVQIRNEKCSNKVQFQAQLYVKSLQFVFEKKIKIKIKILLLLKK